jgi:hypothetical protein
MVYYILLRELKLFHHTKNILLFGSKLIVPGKDTPQIFKTYLISVPHIYHRIQKIIDISRILLTFKEN